MEINTLIVIISFFIMSVICTFCVGQGLHKRINDLKRELEELKQKLNQ